MILCWIAALTAHYLLIFGVWPYYEDDKPLENINNMDEELNALFLATQRTVWAASLGWIVFACVNGYGGNNFIVLKSSLFQTMI